MGRRISSTLNWNRFDSSSFDCLLFILHHLPLTHTESSLNKTRLDDEIPRYNQPNHLQAQSVETGNVCEGDRVSTLFTIYTGIIVNHSYHHHHTLTMFTRLLHILFLTIIVTQ